MQSNSNGEGQTKSRLFKCSSESGQSLWGIVQPNGKNCQQTQTIQTIHLDGGMGRGVQQKDARLKLRDKHKRMGLVWMVGAGRVRGWAGLWNPSCAHGWQCSLF